MNPDNDPDKGLKNRLNNIEMSLGYLQRDFESQNEMILVDAKRILKLEETVKRLNETVELLSSQSNLPGKPEDEKPPHY